MAKQGNYMRQRLLADNEHKIRTAKIALIGLGALIVLIGLVSTISLGMWDSQFVNLIIGGSLILIGFLAKKHNILTYQLGFLLCLLLALVNLVGFRILGAFLFGLAASPLYYGIEAAKYFNDRNPKLIHSEDILDAEFLGDDQ